MENGPDADNQDFEPLPESILQWGLSLMRSQGIDRDAESGVMAFGRGDAEASFIVVMVGPNTNLDDTETFPESIEGYSVVYERLPLPDEQEEG